jgi:hypothetical protein
MALELLPVPLPLPAPQRGTANIVSPRAES